MRIFSFIFSVYILLLSLVPCEEISAKAELRLDEIQIQTTNNETGDDCSPFCICSCCHFSTVYQFKTFSVTNKISASAIHAPNFSYENPYAQIYKTSIWQPPKFNSRG